MKLGIPNIIVHPDLYMVSRDNFGDVESRVAHMICEAAEKYNILLEINLTDPRMFLLGLRDKITYPCREFWKIATKYNIKVVYGIDAHYIESISSYEESLELTKQVIGKDIINKLNFLEID